jgi:outer membrane protein
MLKVMRQLSVMFVTLALSGVAAPAWSMDLLQAWQMALGNDPTYQSARASYRAAAQKTPQARAALLPEIEGSLTGAYLDNRATGTFGQVFQGSRSAWTLNLTQPVFNWSAIQSFEQSKLVVASAEVQLQQAYQDLMLRVSESYFSVLALQDELQALKAEQRSIAEQLSAAKRRFELGDATVTDALEAQARFDLTAANIIGLENELRNAEDELARIIGRQPMPQTLYPLPYNVALPAPEPNKLSAWSDQAKSANLNVVRAQIQSRIAEYDIQIAKSGHYPSVNLVASTTSNTVGNSQVRPFYDGRTIDNTVGLTLSVPIYSGGGVNAEVVEKAELQQKSVYDLEAEKRRSLQLSRQFFNGVKAGLARVKGLEAAEKSSLSALKANMTGYEIGVRINLDVLDAQRQLFITKRDLAAARYNTLLTSLRLRANSGVLSESDLFAINQLLKPPGSPGTGIMHDIKQR